MDDRPKNSAKKVSLKGWRKFECDECGQVFERSTRCATSPSCDKCSCDNTVHPTGYRFDESLEVDGMLNLVHGEAEIELKASNRDEALKRQAVVEWVNGPFRKALKDPTKMMKTLSVMKVGVTMGDHAFDSVSKAMGAFVLDLVPEALETGLHQQIPDTQKTSAIRISQNEHDWPEDHQHENGNYQCKCCYCDVQFIGHKRRVVCKKCSQIEQV